MAPFVVIWRWYWDGRWAFDGVVSVLCQVMKVLLWKFLKRCAIDAKCKSATWLRPRQLEGTYG